MSLTISSARACYHADNIKRIVAPTLFDHETGYRFFNWLDSLITSPQDKTEKAKNLVGSVPCDYSYRVVARHPFLLEGYQHKKNNALPEAVSKVFGKLFSNYEGYDPYSKEDLENFVDSMVNLVGYDVLFRASENGGSRDTVENSSRVLHR